jgi:ATP-binding cassette subfamily F protein uup
LAARVHNVHPVSAPARERVSPARARKLSFAESKELEALPARIEALEREQADIGRRLADPSLYREQPQDVQRLNRRYAAIDRELTSILARWEELEAVQTRSG